MLPVFVVAETRDSYSKTSGWGDGDCNAVEVSDDPPNSRALYDVFPSPPDEESGSKENEQNRAACTYELLQLVIGLRG